jgi:hypothetical protein
MNGTPRIRLDRPALPSKTSRPAAGPGLPFMSTTSWTELSDFTPAALPIALK